VTPAEAAALFEAYDPARDGPFDRRRAAHLLRRAGFGGTAGDIDDAVARGPADTLAWVLADPGPADPLADGVARVLAGRLDTEPLRGMQTRWLDRMLRAPRPLVERLTLFWHDHFATSFRKVGDPVLMERQVLTLRAFALASFRALLAAVARDPAMLVWLDGNENRKAHPNENFARELLELFALGVGHYTEQDVREAARAFTGWHVRDRDFRFVQEEHDDGPKSLLGEKGRLSGDDVIRIVLERPRAAQFLAAKLLDLFVGPIADEALVEPVARRLRDTRYAIRPAVEMILRSRLFFGERAIGRKVRSPVDYALGAVLALGARVELGPLAADIDEMGLSLLQPPDVDGWEGGAAWINAATLGARYRFAKRLTSETGGPGDAPCFDPLAILEGRRIRDPEASVDHFLSLLLAREVGAGTREELVTHARNGPGGPAERAREVVRLILTLPEAHLG